jgi:hypothetical protein
MNPELEAFKDALDKDTGDGRDMIKVGELADAYVAAHPEVFVDMQDFTIDDAVRAVEVFRAAGMDKNEWEAEIWVQHKFGPQVIGGAVQPTLRIPGLGTPAK